MLEQSNPVEVLKKKLEGHIQDRDVFLYEQIEKNRREPFLLDMLQVISKDKDCTPYLWEEIADVCFEVLSNTRYVDDNKRLQATALLAEYRKQIKKKQVTLTPELKEIPDDILKPYRNRARMSSQLRGPLHKIDLKVMQNSNEQELDNWLKDASLLVAVIEKRLHELASDNVKIVCTTIPVKTINRKQMLHIKVVRKERIKKEGLSVELTHPLYDESFPYKKSDQKTIEEINKVITELNNRYSLNTALV